MKDDRLISLNAAIDAMLKLQTEDIEAYGASIPEGFDGDRAVAVLKALPSATDTNVGGNLSVDELIKVLNPESNYVFYDDAHGFCINTQDVLDHLCAMPSAQPNLDEWCDDCKEYDNERHSCPRWNRVIRQTVEDMKAAQSGEDIKAMCGECDAWNRYKNYPQPGWIPWDSGGFPEESGTYTVTAYDGATKRVTYAKYQKRLKRWELTGARAYWRVIAWQPLPTPYREGGQNDG